MTRINTIPVGYLTDQHLMAEYRELPMVMASLRRSLKSKNGVTGIPENYTLNTGHVKFFYNKGMYLHQRYSKLIDELRYRDYNINPAERAVAFDLFFDNGLYNDWTPTLQDHQINLARIFLRVSERDGWYKYLGQNISYDKYYDMINGRLNKAA